MKTTLSLGSVGSNIEPEDKDKKTILLYSPDMDFCMSFRLLYQDHYHLITTTDPKFLTPSVRVLRPDLFVADTQPTELTWHCLLQLKSFHQCMRIILLYVEPRKVSAMPEYIPSFIDVALHKPLDIAELSSRIDELLNIPTVEN